MKVDDTLYTLIFGESILNDSVAIVLFSVLGKLKGLDFTLALASKATLSFISNFCGSVMIGLLIGLLTALILKHSQLSDFPSLETCIIILLAYSSYLLSNAIQLSGIVSLLFCGITMKHYANDNMSWTTRRTVKSMFRVLSQLSENFIFIYLGVTLFTKSDAKFLWGLILATLGIIMIARYLSVIPLSAMINHFSSRDSANPVIPRNHQLMIFWAGLRGAIAFALSFEVTGASAEAIQTTILVTCVTSIIILGGSTPFALQYLQIKTGSEHESMDADSSDDDDFRASLLGNDIRDSPIRHSIESDYRRSDYETRHWFLNFDNRWLKPLFTKPIRLSRQFGRSNISISASPLQLPNGSRLFGRGQDSAFSSI